MVSGCLVRMASYTILLLVLLQFASANCQNLSSLMRFGPQNPASLQLIQFQENNPKPLNYTTSSGNPVYDPGNVLTAGQYGPMLIMDTAFINEHQHFNRERIPERVVHAKGAGAMGELIITSSEISKYSKASLFSEVGKITPLFIRFSQVAGESGSADTVRDFRGFSIKFYTEEGNWDLVGLNFPVFWIRDPLLFPSFVHSQKRNPVTHLRDWNMFWDFITIEPMTTFASMLLHSDLGIPKNYRTMNGFGPNTFSFVNAEGNVVYCKFHMVSNQGVKNLDPQTAAITAGVDPDYYIRDLYNNIALGNYPSWNFSVQIMNISQAKNFPWNPFDVTKLFIHQGSKVGYYSPERYQLVPEAEPREPWFLTPESMSRELHMYIAKEIKTLYSRGAYNILSPAVVQKLFKLWPLDQYPLQPIGVFTLNTNPENYFSQVEQAAFDTQRMPPGIEASPDKLLQGRLFAYTDTQMHRVGVNNELIAVNAPFRTIVSNRNRDGPARTGNNQDGSPNYYPNSFNGPRGNPRGKMAPFPVKGNVAVYDTSNEDNFSQPSLFWNSLSQEERNNIVSNIASTLTYAAPFIQMRAVKNYKQVNEDFGNALAQRLGMSGK